ncbi:SDR family oxidoreductase [Pontixanthobacter aestiaquae]|uniref:Glucose 1-dehydrogenase n=1 Tax=Pontixanthobacter aestiaquae TaxID=1509367 RepID=A0A844ZEG3_9SPHN|nr:SDR family oxidoreductase [Pontixanthobacter aestiaquae]MDN3644848.1 SDR family oxidoreductase [Pontixanthobacter aestiaquae]MXO84149.1 glucose 1-dehydrogenase [Pontixanthobacter aestiaquae]
MNSGLARFTGKTVIVTGSSSGIGEGIARRFAEEGANIVLNSRNRADCEKVAETLDADRTLIVEGDVSSPEFAARIVRKTVEQFGALDVLVNNAGIARMGQLADARDKDIDAVIDINVKGVLYLSRSAIPELLKTKGNIINIASVSGLGGDWMMPIYNASKGAVVNLTRAMALQLGAQGVRVNCVCPSLTRSDMTDGVTDNDGAMKAIKNRMPLGRAAEPEEIAGPVAFLASEDAVFVTGVNMAVDGGVSASNGQPNFFG